MTQWWFRACVLMFLLTLLQCQDRKIYVIEHWHWRASVSSARREVHPSDARDCNDARACVSFGVNTEKAGSACTKSSTTRSSASSIRRGWTVR